MGNDNYTGKLVNYFKKNLAKGYTLDSLKYSLINQGYSRTLVERAIERANKELAAKAPIIKEKPQIKYEVIDEEDNPIIFKKSFWKRIFGLQ
jgi:hypothetical protein